MLQQICGAVAGLAMAFAALAADPQAKPAVRPGPELRKQGTATQMIVDGKPFLMLAGELHNSSASSLEYMKPIWPRLKAMHLNTVLATVSWELLEPREHEFDFRLVDGLLRDARANNMRLGLLWFGSWKNGVSSYVPLWVKKDLARFPRARKQSGENLEVLSTLSGAARDADAAAFAALMRHIKQVDAQRTVILVQVENEVGILGEARDHSPAADGAWSKPVPGELMEYLNRNKGALLPETKAVWGGNGFRTSGTWAEVFGTSPEADEVFMAWHYGRYIGKVTAAGKKEYPLPMYVNAWLVQNATQKPGGYPSGGPVSRMMDIWRAAAPEVDLLAPDIYLPDFKAVTASYHRSGNPLFIPEARGGAVGAANAFWAIGQHDAMGFSPFGIDGIAGLAGENATREDPLGLSYQVLNELTPTIAKYNGTGKMAGILQDQEQTESIVLGDYRLNIQFTPARGMAAPGRGYGLAICTGPDEYLIAGTGFTVRFAAESPGPKVARIGHIDEGHFVDGKWVPGRRLNGDEDGGGTHMTFGRLGIQRITLYRHD